MRALGPDDDPCDVNYDRVQLDLPEGYSGTGFEYVGCLKGRADAEAEAYARPAVLTNPDIWRLAGLVEAKPAMMTDPHIRRLALRPAGSWFGRASSTPSHWSRGTMCR